MFETGIKQKSIQHAFQDFNNDKRHTIHRLNLLKKMGLVDNVGKLVFRRVISYKELREAYSLSYRIFLMNNYIEPHFMGMRIREWEICPKTATFIAEENNQIVGISTLAYDIEKKGLPSEWLYKEEIHNLRKISGKIMEASNEAMN